MLFHRHSVPVYQTIFETNLWNNKIYDYPDHRYSVPLFVYGVLGTSKIMTNDFSGNGIIQFSREKKLRNEKHI